MESLPFLEDIYPPNFLYALIVRSPVAKGKLVRIETPDLPENFTLITAKDIPAVNRLEDTQMPVLADTDLNYIGEPVAILLGHDKTKLDDIFSRCVVIAEESKAVFNCDDAPDSPALFREIISGNPDDALTYPGRIVTGSYSTGIQDQWYAEPAGAVTWYKDEENNPINKKPSDAPGKLVVKTATQWPNHVKRSVCCLLGIDQACVFVEPTSLNLHMDGKLWYPSLISCLASLGTYITNMPVRMVLSREEDFLYSPKRCNTSIDIAATIDDKGNIKAADIDISVNLGAYGVNEKEILDQVCLGALGFHGIDHFKMTAKADYTNIPPQGPFTGFGIAQGLFAVERHISLIADISGMDPASWRENYTQPVFLNGSSLPDGDVRVNELVNIVIKESDYYRRWASYELLRQTRSGKPHEKSENPRGIGISAGFQGNGLLYRGEDENSCGVEVTLTKEGVLEINTSITSTENYDKIWKKIAALTISIDEDLVRVTTFSPDGNLTIPDCGPSCASRNISVVTKLVEECCIEIRNQRFHDPLPITVRRSAQPKSGSLYGGNFNVTDINGFSRPSLAAAVVEVTLDLAECIPRIRGIWIAVDGGRIISVNRARRNLSRTVAQAFGWSFTENLEYINGAIPINQYHNFSITNPIDMPPVNIYFQHDNEGEARGIGELPFTCIPAAFLQAVSQAMDHSFKSIPLKRKDIWEIVRIRNDEIRRRGHNDN